MIYKKYHFLSKISQIFHTLKIREISNENQIVTLSLLFALALVGANLAYSADFNPAMQSYIDSLKREAKATNPNFTDFDYSRGERIFATKSKGKNGEMISC